MKGFNEQGRKKSLLKSIIPGERLRLREGVLWHVQPRQWIFIRMENNDNAKTGRAGHLFQGRYRAILVDKDHYAMELSRYIHLNPVRAHMVKDPQLYPWRSYKDYLGDRKGWDWVKTDLILEQISRNEKKQKTGRMAHPNAEFEMRIPESPFLSLSHWLLSY